MSKNITGRVNWLKSHDNESLIGRIEEDVIDIIEQNPPAVLTGTFQDGTQANPSITFSDDLDLGIYRKGSDNLTIVANNTELIDVNTTNTVINNTLNIPTGAVGGYVLTSDPSGNATWQLPGATVVGTFNDGTETNPSITFTNDLDTGIFRPGVDELCIVGNGSALAHFVSGSAPNQIVDSGIIADYQFLSQPNIGVDSQNGNNIATEVGSPLYTASYTDGVSNTVNNVVDYDGASNFVNELNVNILSFPALIPIFPETIQPWSISIMVSFDALPSGLFIWRTADSSERFRLYTELGEIQLLLDNGSNFFAARFQTITLDTWYNITLVSDPAAAGTVPDPYIKIYVNNTLLTSASGLTYLIGNQTTPYQSFTQNADRFALGTDDVTFHDGKMGGFLYSTTAWDVNQVDAVYKFQFNISDDKQVELPEPVNINAVGSASAPSLVLNNNFDTGIYQSTSSSSVDISSGGVNTATFDSSLVQLKVPTRISDTIDLTGYTNNAEGNILIQNATDSNLYSDPLSNTRTIQVSANFNQETLYRTNTIAQALINAAALTPTAANPVNIQLYTEVYTENVQLVIPSHVSITGTSIFTKTQISLGSALGTSFIQLSPNSLIEFVAISGNNLAPIGLEITSGSNILCSGLNISNFTANIKLQASSTFTLGNSNLLMFAPGQIGIDLSEASSEIILVDVGLVDFSGQNCKGVVQSNATSVLGLNSVVVDNLLTGIESSAGSITAVVCLMRGCSTGWDLSSTTGTVTINSSFIQNTTVHYNVSSGVQGFVYSSTSETDKIVNASSTFLFNFYDNNPDNERGIHNLGGNLIIGDRANPVISYFGEGSTNVQGIVVLKTDDDISFTDVSNDLKPSVGSNVTVFDDLTNGIFYIGDSNLFGTITCSITQILTLGAGSVVFEYWNGSSWTSFNTMSSKDEAPYTTYASDLFSQVDTEDIRFQQNLLLTSGSWTQNTINTITKYWVRLRITSTITQSPIINTFKVIGNTTKINTDGTIQKYGLARTEKSLFFDVGLFENTSSQSNPASQDIYPSQNIPVGRANNEYSQGDGGGLVYVIPPDFDSSSPLRIVYAYSSDNAAASQPDFEITINAANVAEGNEISTTSGGAPASISTETQVITPLPVDAVNGRNLKFTTSEFFLPSSKASDVNGDQKELIYINIERTDATNSNNLVFSQVSLSYTSWREGITRM